MIKAGHILFFLWVGLLLTAGCKQKDAGKELPQPVSDSELIHGNMNQLTKLIVYDVFSPTVASRIYAYTSLATYETIRFTEPDKYPSIVKKLSGFTVPEPMAGEKYNYPFAATIAFFTVTRKLTFSVDSLLVYESDIKTRFQNSLDSATYNRSIDFGTKMGQAILARSITDNYPQSRGKPKFIGSQEPGKWRPTPPDYLDGVEYCWGTMKTFVLDSSSQFSAPSPPPYSEDSTSVFYKANRYLYNLSQNLTEEQKTIARYWDDNSFVIEHSGHMMFANKKITPGGHWIGITEIACKMTKADPVKAAQAYALTSITIFDAFVNCWQDKYLTNVIRPVTVINEQLDPNWMPYLQTPPFPEYPSGHSTITAAAATVLTLLFGDKFEFLDTSDLEYIGMQRKFSSFMEAAQEASISRVYGGIHFTHSVEAGAIQGRKVGEYVIRKLNVQPFPAK